MKKEQISDLYLSEKFLIDKQIKERVSFQGFRYYIDNGNLLPSVTSVINKYSPNEKELLKWYCSLGYEAAKKESFKRAIYGSFLHIVFEKILLGEQIDLDFDELYNLFKFSNISGNNINMDEFLEWHDYIKQDVVGFIQWIQDFDVEPIALETILSTKNFAGTLDCVAYITVKEKRVLVIIDFKSGRHDFYNDNIIQLQACLELWNWNYRNLPISEIYNYAPKNYRLPVGKTVTPYNFKCHTEKSDIRKRWKYYLAMYIREHRDVNFKKLFIISEKKVDRDTNINDIIIQED